MVGEVVKKRLVEGRRLPVMASGGGGRRVHWRWEQGVLLFFFDMILIFLNGSLMVLVGAFILYNCFFM
jgi:hypothetical protein